jgi:hypothetical protein
LENELQVLREETKNLSQKKSFFQRHTKKIESNREHLLKLEKTLEGKKNLRWNRNRSQKNLAQISQLALQEIKDRKEEKKFLLKKNVDLYETEELLNIKTVYETMVRRQRTQVLYYQDQLKKKSGEVSKETLQFNDFVNSLKQKLEKTTFTLQTVTGELAGRNYDRTWETEEFAAKKVQEKQAQEYQAKRIEKVKEQKEREELLKTSILSPLKKQKEEAEAKKIERRENLKNRIIFVLSLFIVLFVVILVRKALSP